MTNTEQANLSCNNYIEDANITNIFTVQLVVETIALGVLNLMVICGNILVILAVGISRKLRSVTNHFIVSLAMADLLLGVSVLPFSATLELLSFWVFGKTWCVIWLAVDVLICTASILNLCAISLDRYIAITRPMSYCHIMSKCRAKTLIAAVWIVAFLISFPPLVGWNERNNSVIGMFHTYNRKQCTLTSEPSYIVYSALGSFFIPMCIMLFLYWRIYREATEAMKSNKRGYKLTRGNAAVSNLDEALRSSLVLRIHRGNSSRSKDYLHRCMYNGYAYRSAVTGTNRKKRDRLRCFIGQQTRNGRLQRESERSGRKSSTKITEHLKKLHKETRAAKTLAIIVGVFILCWMPFFTVYLIGAFCPNCTPTVVFKIFFWAGYCNSAINPFIYARFSKDFRHAFKYILGCCSKGMLGKSSMVSVSRCSNTGRDSVIMTTIDHPIFRRRSSSRSSHEAQNVIVHTGINV
uniref:Probable G-protein coupled receptor No9-like n=1 Tax=Saccoglossus kowalevskii TaxID=10224 RepID=A0ABM0MT41_SACKO|nr:PREDICTED: probable G-protein coupled receptor No9-like [Saccoglossus kowalevskii]